MRSGAELPRQIHSETNLFFDGRVGLDGGGGISVGRGRNLLQLDP